MALDFGPQGSSSRVAHGNDTSVQFTASMSFMLWTYIDTLPAASQQFVEKNEDIESFVAHWVATDVFQWTNKTVSWNTEAGAACLQTGQWNCLAGFSDPSLSSGYAEIWWGDLTNPLVNQTLSFSSRDAGTGIHTNSLLVGNVGAFNASPDAKIALLAMWSEVLTIEQMISQQYSLLPVYTSNLEFFCPYGFNSTGTQVDWSGNLNNGTVTGATVANHIPLGYVPPPVFDAGNPSILTLDSGKDNPDTYLKGVKLSY